MHPLSYKSYNHDCMYTYTHTHFLYTGSLPRTSELDLHIYNHAFMDSIDINEPVKEGNIYESVEEGNIYESVEEGNIYDSMEERKTCKPPNVRQIIDRTGPQGQDVIMITSFND